MEPLLTLCQWNRYSRFPTRSLALPSDILLQRQRHCLESFQETRVCKSKRHNVMYHTQVKPKSNPSQTQPTRRAHQLGDQWVRVRGEGIRRLRSAAGRVVTDQHVSGARTWGEASKCNCTRLVEFLLRAGHNKLVLRYPRVLRTGRDCSNCGGCFAKLVFLSRKWPCLLSNQAFLSPM